MYLKEKNKRIQEQNGTEVFPSLRRWSFQAVAPKWHGPACDAGTLVRICSQWWHLQSPAARTVVPPTSHWYVRMCLLGARLWGRAVESPSAIRVFGHARSLSRMPNRWPSLDAPGEPGWLPDLCLVEPARLWAVSALTQLRWNYTHLKK